MAKTMHAADLGLQPLSAVSTSFQHLEHGDAPSRAVINVTGAA